MQLWITESLQKPLTQKISFNLQNEWRFGSNISEFYFVYLQGLLAFNINQRFEIDTAYRQIWHIQESKFRLAYEPIVNLIYQRESLQVRNRFSYLIREKRKNAWIYRGRIWWSGYVNVYDHTLQPYLSNEIFLEVKGGFNQNRSSIGILTPLIGKLRGDFYYMLRFLKRDRQWSHQHVFGTWFVLDF